MFAFRKLGKAQAISHYLSSYRVENSKEKIRLLVCHNFPQQPNIPKKKTQRELKTDLINPNGCDWLKNKAIKFLRTFTQRPNM